ncbi:MAG TPA: DUF4384 domain-containing protein [Longimicrobium sp.]|nr:DUF4384 domain-containing protein [Longimicrobium sp.]
MMTRQVPRLLLALAFLAAPAAAAAQALPERGEGYVVVLEPREWMGEGARGIVRGRAVRVEGLAHHASGIRQVSINGTPAVLRRQGGGATRFSGRLTAAELERDVEIVAYPVAGDPIARIQRPDGSFLSGALTAVRPPLPALAPAEVGARLRVSLQALSPETARVVAASFAGTSGIVEAPRGSQPHLAVAAEANGYLVLGRDGSVRHRVEARSPVEGAAALRPVLEQEMGALQLEELAAPAETFPLEMLFTSGTGRFRTGDAVELRVVAGRGGYLTLVDLGTDGTVVVLYPSEVDDPRVPPMHPVHVPSAELRARFAPDPPYQAAEPYGRGVVRAFVTPRPLTVTVRADGSVPAEAVLRALRDATTEPATGRAIPWATAVAEYRVDP